MTPAIYDPPPLKEKVALTVLPTVTVDALSETPALPAAIAGSGSMPTNTKTASRAKPFHFLFISNSPYFCEIFFRSRRCLRMNTISAIVIFPSRLMSAAVR